MLKIMISRHLSYEFAAGQYDNIIIADRGLSLVNFTVYHEQPTHKVLIIDRTAFRREIDRCGSPFTLQMTAAMLVSICAGLIIGLAINSPSL